MLNGQTGMFVDRPGPGSYEYAVTAIDSSGRESPRSHPSEATCGPLDVGPRIIACKPFSHAREDEFLPVRAVVLPDRGVAEVRAVYRHASQRSWRRATMQRRFRDSFMGEIPGADVAEGTIQGYVEATDGEGRKSQWPAATASGLQRSLTVT